MNILEKVITSLEAESSGLMRGKVTNTDIHFFSMFHSWDCQRFHKTYRKLPYKHRSYRFRKQGILNYTATKTVILACLKGVQPVRSHWAQQLHS